LEAAIESEINLAEELLEKAEKIAREEDYQVETDLFAGQGSASQHCGTSPREEDRFNRDGRRNQRRFGQFNLENVVPYVLKNATCQVMLYSQYNP